MNTIKVKREDIFKGIDEKLLSKFLAFHSNNPVLYNKFEELSLLMVKTGRKKYSAWAVINKIRWDHDITTHGDSEFKISNDFIALYARLFAYRNVEYPEFFQLKQMKRQNRLFSSPSPEIKIVE